MSVLAITSGKGGVGKTVLAANLAAALARRGRRVLALDADLGLANLDVVLDLSPRHTLQDVVNGVCQVEEAVVAAPGGFDVLLAGAGLVEYSRMTPPVRDSLLAVMSCVLPLYDHIVLDTGAGISDAVLFTVSLAPRVVMVTTPDPTALTDAYATTKVLAQLQGRQEVDLVVNQARHDADGAAIHARLQAVVDKFLNPGRETPVRLVMAGAVPHDVQMRESVRKRQVLFLSHPQAAASRAVAALAEHLDSAQPQAEATPGPHTPS